MNLTIHKGEKEKKYGLYCETVIDSKKDLLVPNALKDDKWKKNPDIKRGVISYMGVPILFPDRRPFGTICVLDQRENYYTPAYLELLTEYAKLAELDLLMMESCVTMSDEAELDFGDFTKRLSLEISERKEREKLLQHNYEQFEDFAKKIPGVVYQFYVDKDRNFSIKYVAMPEDKLLQETLQEQKPLFSETHPDDLPGLMQSINSALTQKWIDLAIEFSRLKIEIAKQIKNKLS